MKTESYIESFLDYTDAFLYLENKLLANKDAEVIEAGIRWLSHRWQAYASFSSKEVYDGT